MLMAWRSLRQRSCASTTLKTLELNVALDGSTTFMALLEHGKVNSFFAGCLCVLLLLKHTNICLTGGREKAPAAFCRKAITSTDKFEMWGDGLQTRSFTFIDECVEGVLR